jgi:hypothetical protein
MNGVLTEVQFWAIAFRAMERTILCSPDIESRIKCWIDARGLSGLYTVIASPHVPDDRLYIVDQNAIDADTNAMMAQWRPRGIGD